jgi:signal transduction histidine kinase
VAEGPFGVRAADLGIVALAIVAIEVEVIVGNGPGAGPLNAQAYVFGALLAVPIAFRHRYPLRVFAAVALLVLVYYLAARRNISPSPALAVPVYDTALAGFMIPAVIVSFFYMGVGLIIVGLGGSESVAELLSDFFPQIALLALAIVLGELVRSRQALAAETARRLRLAEEERTADAARLLAEERLRIARELHDTVAHSMATITVQAGSALHLLHDSAAQTAPDLQAALTAIRETSKSALAETRSVLGQLREWSPVSAAGYPATGLDRLPALRDAVNAAGTEVTVHIEGAPVTLSTAADHAAYRILQESLTNVLRHAGPGAAATVCLRYRPDTVTITVTDDGPGATSPGGGGTGSGGGAEGGGHGIRGMAERAASVGGSLNAGPLADGGFAVTATLPVLLRPAEGAS